MPKLDKKPKWERKNTSWVTDALRYAAGPIRKNPVELKEYRGPVTKDGKAPKYIEPSPVVEVFLGDKRLGNADSFSFENPAEPLYDGMGRFLDYIPRKPINTVTVKGVQYILMEWEMTCNYGFEFIKTLTIKRAEVRG
jgi:hypothetical protein